MTTAKLLYCAVAAAAVASFAHAQTTTPSAAPSATTESQTKGQNVPLPATTVTPGATTGNMGTAVTPGNTGTTTTAPDSAAAVPATVTPSRANDATRIRNSSNSNTTLGTERTPRADRN
jgi:hypothetical protein